jgi:PKHD-type hydroxylase
MFLAIENVLKKAEVAALRRAAETMRFDDGRKTAGAIARTVKANDQAAASDDLDAVRAKVTAALARHPVFASAARPKALTPQIVSRYRQGQTYGMHVDDALMSGLRADLSYTLFLSDPGTYEGGALIVADTAEERAFKLGAGDLILYPSTTLHRVEPVTSGTRLAVVGWVQSWVKAADEREMLFDLDRAVASLGVGEDSRPLRDVLAKTRSNLIRKWAE